MAKLTLTDLSNLQNETSAVTRINNNNTALETALENTLSRDGTSPNEMQADLDMNSNRIYNLPVPEGLSDAARWQDVVNLQLASTLTGINGFLYLNLATTIPSTTVAANVEAIYVSGYSVAGVGACLWRKVPSLPTHVAYLQSANGYYFVPDVQQLDYTMSAAITGDQVIDAAIALGCGFRLMFAQTGSISLGPTNSDFSTVTSLRLFLTKSTVGEGATLNIKINGHYEAASSGTLWDWNHPDADRITITCGDDYSVIQGRVIQSSGHSVTGTFRDYSVTFKLDSVDGISVGDIARVQYVRDNRRIEWANLGSITGHGALTRTGATTFDCSLGRLTTSNQDVFLNPPAVNDLILWKGATQRIASIVDDNTFTTDAEFSTGDPGPSNVGSYWYRLGGGYGLSNVCTSPSPGTHSTTLNFTDTSVLYLGSIVIADGQAGRIVSIDSPTAVTVHTHMDVPANTPFAIIGLAWCFEGAHEITAVDTNNKTITVLNKACLPESVFDFNADYIKGGIIDIVRAGMRNTTTGDIFNFRTGKPPALIDNIFLWPGTTGYAIETGTGHTTTMHKMSINLGIYCTIVNGFGAMFIFDCDVKCNNSGGTSPGDAYAPMISGCGGTAHCIQQNAGTMYLRGVKFTGLSNTYAYNGSNGAGVYNTQSSVIAGTNSGSYMSAGCGVLGDDQRYYFTGWTDGSGSEAGNIVVFRSIGTSSHDTQIRVVGCAGDGPSYNVGASCRIPGGLIIAQNGKGLINNGSFIEMNGLNILGSGNTNYLSTTTGGAECKALAITNNSATAASVNLTGRSTMVGGQVTLRKGGLENLTLEGNSYFSSDTALIIDGGTCDIKMIGQKVDVYIPNVLNTPVISGSGILNIVNDGSIVRTSNLIYWPQILTTLPTDVNFPVVNSDARSTTTLTVTGAALGDPVLVTTTSAAYIGDTATRITLRAWVSAADTVTIEAMNNTATNSSDPATVTIVVAVLKWT